MAIGNVFNEYVASISKLFKERGEPIPPEAFFMLKDAFYAGSHGVFVAMMDKLGNPDVDSDEIHNLITEIDDELRDYIESLRSSDENG